MPGSIGSVLQSVGGAMPQFLGGPGGTLSSWATGAGDWLNPAGSMTPFTGAPGAFGSNIPSPSFGSADTANLLPSSVNPNPVGGTTGFGTDIPARTVGDTGTVGTSMSAPASEQHPAMAAACQLRPRSRDQASALPGPRSRPPPSKCLRRCSVRRGRTTKLFRASSAGLAQESLTS